MGRDLQPAVYPEEKGFWKWLDIYLTTNRASHVPFTLDQQNGLARKDIVTFYDASGVPPVILLYSYILFLYTGCSVVNRAINYQQVEHIIK